MPFTTGGKVQFPAQTCRACPLRERCTTSSRAAACRSLAHVGRWQGDRTRYLGLRKNLFDLRRVAVVHNLHVIARQPHQTQQAA